MRIRRVLIALTIVLLPGVMLAPVWQRAGLGAGEDDVLYFYPTRQFFHDTVQNGQWPWLNPWTGLGRPFAADPQTALWYPFTWLFAILPPVWAYPLSLWAHYSLAIWGLYRLLRAAALDRRAALFGGIAFGFCGFMLAHRAHFSMQHAVAWTPWVFWRLHRYVATSSPGPSAGAEREHEGAARAEVSASCSVIRLVQAAVVIALQCLAGHVQIAVLTGLGSLVYVLSCKRDASVPPPQPSARLRIASVLARLVSADRRRVVARCAIAWVCAAGLFAVQWLPTLDYLRLCTRVERTYKDFVENSWNPVSALGALLPMVFGQRTPNFFDQPYWGPSHQVEQFAYTGILPLLLAGLAVRSGWRADPRRRPWVILAAFALLLALGQYGPLCPLLYGLPGSSLFRCPARAMFLVDFAVAALAAITLHDLGAKLSPQRARLRAAAQRWTSRPLIRGALLVAIPLALLWLALPLLDTEVRGAATRAAVPWAPAVLLPLLMALVSLTAFGAVVRRWQRPRLLWLPIALTALDLGVIGWTIDVPADRRTPAELLTPRRSAEWLEAVQTSPHRLWVVTGRHGHTPGEYVEPVEKAVADTNMLRQIVALTDYGPLQPRTTVWKFGFKPWGETDDAAALLSDTSWMRLYNVGWILLCDAYWPAPADCELLATTPAGWRLYRNAYAAGWACFEAPDQPGAVVYERCGPSKFIARVDSWPTKSAPRRPARESGDPALWPRLVVSQLALPGWTAQVDGQPAPLELVDGLLLGVRVPPGEALDVVWSYFPPGLRAGAVISLLSAAVLAVSVFWCLGVLVVKK